MSKKEETLTAIQNIGATVFVCGVIGGCMAVNPVTLMICAGAMVVGGVTIAIAEYKLDRGCRQPVRVVLRGYDYDFAVCEAREADELY